MTKKVTIKDIAQNASVSISTVSRVINNSSTVDQAKREAVIKAMAELKYQPNAVARSLVRGRTNTIGVLTQDIGSKFNDTIARGATIGLTDAGYASLVVDGRWNRKIEEKAIANLVERQVDGIIFLGTSLSNKRLQEISLQTPMFVVCHQVDDWEDRNLFVDNRKGAYDATRLLIEFGHRNIAVITGIRGRLETEHRIEGYQAALAEFGIEPNQELICEGDFLAPSGALALESLLFRGVHFSAIFCCNDEVAFGVRLALSRHGLRVPEDISLVGFDDHPLSAFMMPPLTTVRQPAYDLGNEAAKALICILEEQPYQLPHLETELIIRDSVARR